MYKVFESAKIKNLCKTRSTGQTHLKNEVIGSLTKHVVAKEMAAEQNETLKETKDWNSEGVSDEIKDFVTTNFKKANE